MVDTTKAIQQGHDATAGFDITLHPTTTIGTNLTFNSSVRATDYFNSLDFKVQPDSLLFFHGYNAGKNRWKNFTGSLYAEKNIQEGERIRFDIDYLWYKNDNPYEVEGSFLDKNGMKAGNNDTLYASRQRGFAHTSIRVGVVKMDYTKQLNKKLKLEAGIKGTYTQTTSGSGIESLVNGAWISRTETIDNIVMKEGIGAGYVSFRAQLNPLTNLVIGMRYEHAITGMNDPTTGGKLVDRKRGVFFPNLSFIRKLGDQAELQLSFSKRISRPSYNDLAAFVRYSDPTAVLTGNPLLQPTITHNLKLGYNYRDYTFSLLYSRDDHPIARYQLTQNSQQTLLYVSPQNAAWQQNITFQTNVPLKVNEWWRMNYGFVGGWRQCRMEYTLQPVTKSWFGYSANFNQSFKLPKSFVAEVSGWYNSTTYNGTIKLGGFGVLNAGIKKELKNNAGNIQLSATDLLRTFRLKVYFGTVTKEVFAIQNDVTFNLESTTFPIIRLTYTRSFGSLKSQRKTDTGTSDERDRIRKEE
jgi:iron complex outermembrane recepter protein